MCTSDGYCTGGTWDKNRKQFVCLNHADRLDELVEFIASRAIEQTTRPGLTYRYIARKRFQRMLYDALIEELERLRDSPKLGLCPYRTPVRAGIFRQGARESSETWREQVDMRVAELKREAA